MKFNGFGFSGYRSIGDELVKIAPLKKINLIIGQNNSGKSNIITFLKKHLSPLHKRVRNSPQTNPSFSEIDRHLPSKSGRTRVAFPLRPEGEELETYLDQKLPNGPNYGSDDRLHRSLLTKMVTSKPLLKNDVYAWFVYESPTLNGKYELSIPSSINEVLKEDEWRQLWARLTDRMIRNAPHMSAMIPDVIDKLPPLPDHIPPIEFIPAIRKIGKAETKPDDYSGLGIIERLAKIQHPDREQQSLKKDFASINRFLKTVLENEETTIEIPRKEDTILVHMDGKTLPLSSLGTGIHEVIIIAAAATLLKESILCIEEPELHLHPLLQRKLIKYLSENTSNQYIFTTHSAHLLDIDGAEVFHVKYADGATTVDAISTTKEKSNICHDLGYKASDLLQANCVIWVEGPSDRIYINHWLKSIDESLVEGIHYSIMFYGGRLFSHLSGEDKEDLDDNFEDFISVRKLNRNACIVFDSDKDSPRKHLTKTKKRLQKEFDKGPGFAWVTEGREIENYIAPEILEECIQAVHPSAKKIIEKSKWSNLLNYRMNYRKKKTSKNRPADKVKVARRYVDNYPTDLNVFDLNKIMNKLKIFIHDSNGMNKETP